ncbi:hypothetical protein [Bradyrhizobium vignae]|uniref:hypothetical protein n=1 Tax=Bradyrhizobium TaxID=374 RepID=UPI001FE08729|nr:hypothetical protein [Bradyrhizobium vignae]
MLALGKTLRSAPRHKQDPIVRSQGSVLPEFPSGAATPTSLVEALRAVVITGAESNKACDAALFNLANLAEGIGHPPDEMFAARRAAYAISRTRRR